MSDRLQPILESPAFEAFRAHCFMNTHEETCGLFVLKAGAIEFVPCDNHAYDKMNSFLIHPVDFVRCSDEGDVVAVGHSHVVGTSEPSAEDKLNSENCLLPFIIFQPEALTVATYEPNGEARPLLGRTWTLGVSDCYTLARDYYKTHGVILKDYVRNDIACLKTESLFLKYFEENDFIEVFDGPKEHDGILIQVYANIANHCAVMIEGNMILHHLQNRLSCREPWGGYWKRHTLKVLRHKKWL